MAPSVDELHAKLDTWWAIIAPLRPTSSDADYETMASFLTPDAKLWFEGVNAPIRVGPVGAIEALKTMTTYWIIEERRVLLRAASPDGKTIVAEMHNRLTWAGLPAELNELEVVRFNGEGLIESYRLHVDLEPTKEVLARATAANK